MDGKAFIEAVKNITEEKGVNEDFVFDAMEQALMTAYKKNFGSKTNVRVNINRENGDIKVFSYLVVVDDYIEGEESTDEEGNIIYLEPEINEDAQILLDDAQKLVKGIKVGETIEEEVTPADFGRVATLTAKQVLTQKMREAERTSIIDEFSAKQDELMVGLLAMEDNKNYYVDLGRTRGILPKGEMIPDEVVKMGTSIKVYLQKIEATPKGPLILCSRRHHGFVRRLFEIEIPELADGTIVLYSVAREPGVRSKVAVYSTNDRIDPIGTCIGERGSRIGNILAELNGEKIDLILYDEDNAKFIANALSPAKNVIVNILDDTKNREALAIVDEDNLALAIGKKGTNIKLASKLTKFHINVKTLKQITEEGNQDMLKIEVKDSKPKKAKTNKLPERPEEGITEAEYRVQATAMGFSEEQIEAEVDIHNKAKENAIYIPFELALKETPANESVSETVEEPAVEETPEIEETTPVEEVTEEEVVEEITEEPEVQEETPEEDSEK